MLTRLGRTLAGIAALLTAMSPAALARAQDMSSMPGMKTDSAHHQAADTAGAMAGMDMSGDALQRMPPMPAGIPMMEGMSGKGPSVTPWLPGAGVDPNSLTLATPNAIVDLADGDTFNLQASLVRHTINGRTFVMYGFNDQYPGPLIRVKQQATIVVRFVNHLDVPMSVHWHGVRLDNRYDGVPGVTQDPVPPGQTFIYKVHFPDAGVYWYHPHVREDFEQNLGLYGNMLVNSPDPHYYSPVNAEQALMLSDLLIDGHGLFPYGKEGADFTIMGRFGNVLLVNGEPHYRLTAHRGDVVRFYLTDVSNARSWNLSFGGAPIKLVGADVGKFEHEVMVRNVVLSPAQRYIVEVRFDTAGTYYITNAVQALNNFSGEYYSEVDTVGTVTVTRQPAAHDYGAAFRTLRTNADVIADIDKYRQYFDKPPDKQLLLTVNIQGLPVPLVAFMSIDTMYFNPVEWNDGMPDMNWVSSVRETRWIIRDVQTGKENMDIDWHFKQGDVVKIRITNDAASMHPMAHPIHFHGQRFLVLDRDGVRNTDLVWKDTALIPVGSSVDILLDASNPGRWVAHCHIAEHLEAGMHMTFTVDPATSTQ